MLIEIWDVHEELVMNIEWSEEYSVSVEEFDTHHKKLFAMAQQLYEGLENNSSHDELGKIVDALWWYAMHHFKAEEKLMLAKNYPNAKEHIKEHEKLLAKVRNIHARHYVGQNVINQDLLDFFMDWIKNHILKEDMKYVPFLT